MNWEAHAIPQARLACGSSLIVFMTNLSPHVAACEQLLKVLEPKPDIVVETIDTKERLEKLWRIDSEAYGNCSLTLEEFSAWWRRYEFGCRNLKLTCETEALTVFRTRGL